jgi:membrane-associated phospholipid phosphatase
LVLFFKKELLSFSKQEQTMSSVRQTQLAAISSVSLLVIAILFLDRPISTWSHAVLHRPLWCIWLTHVADIPQPASVIGLILAGFAWLCGWRPASIGRLLIIACIATLTADAAKDTLKFAFSRPWPETWVNNNPSWINTGTYGFFPFHGGAGWASFPSGHVTTVIAPCTVFWRHLPRLAWLWAVPPILVALGLIGCDYHFLGDCIGGAIVGASCGALVYRLGYAE